MRVLGEINNGGGRLLASASSTPLDGFATVDRRDWLDKTTDFIRSSPLGFTAPLGDAIGNSITAAGQLLKGDKEGARATAQKNSDNFGRILGSTVASAALPVSLSGIGSVGTFGQRLLSSTGLGAAISGGVAAADGGDLAETAKSAVLGGAVGAALPVAGAGLRAIGDQFDNLPSRFIESALGRSKADVLSEIQKGKDPLAKFVLEKKPIGTAESIIKGSSKAIEDLGAAIQTKLSEAVRTTGGKITIARDNFLDELVKIPEAQGALLKRADVQAILERLAPQTKRLLQRPSWNLQEANSLRQLVDRTVGDKGFLSSQLSTDKQILRTFANSLREAVKTKAPDETRALFSELSNEIKLRDALLEKLAKRAGNQVLSFGDFIGGGLGGIFGGGVPGAIAGVATRRAIESVPFKLGAAKTIAALTKAGPILDQLAPSQQTALLTLFAEIFSPDAEEPQSPALPQ